MTASENRLHHSCWRLPSATAGLAHLPVPEVHHPCAFLFTYRAPDSAGFLLGRSEAVSPMLSKPRWKDLSKLHPQNDGEVFC